MRKVILLLIPLALFAQSKVGTAGMLFLELSPSARASGMAQAFVAIADDASALYFNPAGIAWQHHRQFLGNVLAYHPEIDIYIHHVACVFPVSELIGAVGVSFTFLDAGWMKVTVPGIENEGGVDSLYTHWTGDYFTARAGALQVSYAKKLTEKFSVGISLKGIYSAVYEYSTWGVAGDIGTFYDTGIRSLKIGMMISNFGPDMCYITETFPLPMLFKVGISYVPYETKTQRLIVDIEGEHPNHNYERLAIGAEWSFNNFFFLRGGFRLAQEPSLYAERYSFGLGVRGGPVGIDVSYTDWSSLGMLMRGQITLNF